MYVCIHCIGGWQKNYFRYIDSSYSYLTFFCDTLAVEERGTLGRWCSSSAAKLRRLITSGETPANIYVYISYGKNIKISSILNICRDTPVTILILPELS